MARRRRGMAPEDVYALSDREAYAQWRALRAFLMGSRAAELSEAISEFSPTARLLRASSSQEALGELWEFVGELGLSEAAARHVRAVRAGDRFSTQPEGTTA